MGKMSKIKLYDYWRSSASYRVRIALNLKDLAFTSLVVNLLDGEHKGDQYAKIHPQGIVPAIEIDGKVFTQSLAIIEHLDEIFPTVPLLPLDGLGRARVRSLSYAIAMEIHPLCNLSVVNHVATLTKGGDPVKQEWMKKFIHSGLGAFEACLDDGQAGKFCHENRVSMADCCLIPQLYNAKRWGVDYRKFEKICAIEENCLNLDAFGAAHPDRNRPA